MRADVDRARILHFLQRLGERAREPSRLYLTGGATAALEGWRATTVDIDLKFEPDRRELFEAIPQLKDELDVNIELASPGDFIPELPGWRDRSLYVASFGKLAVYHYDPYAQALSKIERDHPRDRVDVQAMIDRGLVERARLGELFEAIAPELIRYPAVDPDTFRARLHAVLHG